MKAIFEGIDVKNLENIALYFNLESSKNRQVKIFFKDLVSILHHHGSEIDIDEFYGVFERGIFSRYSCAQQSLSKEFNEEERICANILYLKDENCVDEDKPVDNTVKSYDLYFCNVLVNLFRVDSFELIKKELMDLPYIRTGKNFSKSNFTKELRRLKKRLFVPDKSLFS